MFTSVVIAALLAGPPNGADARQQRIQDIAALAQSAERSSIDQTVALIPPGPPTWERIYAMKALVEHHKEQALPALIKAMDDSDVDVRTEATIRVCQWAPNKQRLKRLAGLRERGVNLRRAFQTGESKGRPLYRAEATQFFADSMAHANIRTKLDGALGLVEVGQEPSVSAAIKTFEDVLKEGTVSERRLAVHHMYVSFNEPRFLPLLKLAQEDEDPTVRRIADTLVSRR